METSTVYIHLLSIDSDQVPEVSSERLNRAKHDNHATIEFLSLFDPVQNLNTKLTVITIVGDQLHVESVYFIQLLNSLLHEPFMAFGMKQTDMNFLTELLFGTKNIFTCC